MIDFKENIVYEVKTKFVFFQLRTRRVEKLHVLQLVSAKTVKYELGNRFECYFKGLELKEKK